MRLLHCAIIAAAISAAPSVAAQDFNPVSDDIIATYTEMIARKPSSYDLYLSRATEYLSRGLVAPALSDLNDALRLAPSGEKGVRFEILSRRADILERQMDYEAALADIDVAADLYPDIPSNILAKGRILTAMGRYTEATDAFNRLRRISPRDAQAFFGLAKAAALAGDSDAALRYANEGVELAPRSGSSFIARAEIYKLLGRRDEAINQYITAINCGDEGAGRAMQILADLSYEGYPEVMAAFDKAISDNPTSATLYYLRATMAQAHEHHASALADFGMIDGAGPFANGALGSQLAESLLALDRPDEALKALEGLPQHARNAQSETLRARVLHTLGQYEDAVEAAHNASELDGQSYEPLIALARALMALGRNDEASAALASAIMLEAATIPEAYIMQASLASPARREMLLEQVLDLPFDPADPASLRGFALLALDRKDEAIIWANSLMRLDTAHDGIAPYTAACLFAQAGMKDESLAALAKAREAGYDNILLIERDDAPLISLAPARPLPAGNK